MAPEGRGCGEGAHCIDGQCDDVGGRAMMKRTEITIGGRVGPANRWGRRLTSILLTIPYTFFPHHEPSTEDESRFRTGQYADAMFTLCREFFLDCINNDSSTIQPVESRYIARYQNILSSNAIGVEKWKSRHQACPGSHTPRSGAPNSGFKRVTSTPESLSGHFKS